MVSVLELMYNMVFFIVRYLTKVSSVYSYSKLVKLLSHVIASFRGSNVYLVSILFFFSPRLLLLVYVAKYL